MFDQTPAANLRTHRILPRIVKLMMLALCLALSGVYYANLSNENHRIHKQIAQLECELSICETSTTQLKAQAEAQCNRWALLDRLNQYQSELSPIATQQIEVQQTRGTSIMAKN